MHGSPHERPCQQKLRHKSAAEPPSGKHKSLHTLSQHRLAAAALRTQKITPYIAALGSNMPGQMLRPAHETTPDMLHNVTHSCSRPHTSCPPPAGLRSRVSESCASAPTSVAAHVDTADTTTPACHGSGALAADRAHAFRAPDRQTVMRARPGCEAQAARLSPPSWRARGRRQGQWQQPRFTSPAKTWRERETASSGKVCNL